jgi:predicted SAM-dependent methyltransferase
MMQRFPIKRTAEGSALINVGCGYVTHPEWNNLDFSTYARLAHRPLFSAMLRRLRILSNDRYEHLCEIDRDVILWDLRRGIPFPDRTFDAVYHSHFLEHIPREAAAGFLAECHRVLKPGGTLRIAVPDLHRILTSYVASIDRIAAGDESGWKEYDETLNELFDQMVRKTPFAMAQQPRVVQWIERAVRGSAHRAGETHQWMYDQYSLGRLLQSTGYHDVQRQSAHSSRIRRWVEFHLDADAGETVRKPDSVFIEAVA